MNQSIILWRSRTEEVKDKHRNGLEVEVFWVVTVFSVAERCPTAMPEDGCSKVLRNVGTIQHLKMEAARSSETSVSYHNT
jgi:hypothetical protein